MAERWIGCDHAEYLIVQHRRWLVASQRVAYGPVCVRRFVRARELAEAYLVALGRTFGGWDDQQLEEGI